MTLSSISWLLHYRDVLQGFFDQRVEEIIESLTIQVSGLKSKVCNPVFILHTITVTTKPGSFSTSCLWVGLRKVIISGRAFIAIFNLLGSKLPTRVMESEWS